MKIPNKVYDVLKWVAIIALPALNVLVVALGVIWGFDTSAIAATIAAVQTFLGAILGISNIGYKKSEEAKEETLVVNPVDDTDRAE